MEWFKTWFNSPYYHLLYQNRDLKEAQDFLVVLLEALSLKAPQHIIDLGCGKGRHSVFLNTLGFHVLGLDLSEESISAGKNYENPNLEFRVHDMRDPIDSEPVDAVFNLFTSFGYFTDPKDDEKVFKAVSEVLKPGGYFVLDFLNRELVISSLVPKSTVERGEVLFDIEKAIVGPYVRKDVRFTAEGRDQHFYELVKLHTPESIEKMALDYGLEKINLWGDYSLSPFEKETSPRAITVLRKK